MLPDCTHKIDVVAQFINSFESRGLVDYGNLLKFATAVPRGWGFLPQRMCHGDWKPPSRKKVNGSNDSICLTGGPLHQNPGGFSLRANSESV
jgi:hypothetical protein